MEGILMRYIFWTISFIWAFSSVAKASDVYLFYSASSDYLHEIDIATDEIKNVFDGEFGTVVEELPNEVKFEDFYVSRFPDKSYVFLLNAPFSCGQIGCGSISFERAEDGKLYELDSKKPLKCKTYDTDKLLCTEGGYKPEIDFDFEDKSRQKKKILRYPAPITAD